MYVYICACTYDSTDKYKYICAYYIYIYIYIYIYVYMSQCVYVRLQNYICYNSKHFWSSPSRSIGPLQNPVLWNQGTFSTADSGRGA